MILCLDVGNSQLYCGVYEGEFLRCQFRRTSAARASSDELGVFLLAALRENGVDPKGIERIALSSVVPDMLHSLRACCQKYFHLEPMVLQPGVRTGLKILYKNPKEVGADRIADALGAVTLFPDRHLIVVDFGTATTITAISKRGEFLGGNILPGVRLALEALVERTAKLPAVEIVPAEGAIGRSTVESIQNGVYWSNVGMVKELSARMTAEAFPDEAPLVIGTGGFSHLFDQEDLFDAVVPELILVGLREALRLND
jgi:type III pantothenate kinase